MLPGHGEFLFLPFQGVNPEFHLFRLRTALPYILIRWLSDICRAVLRFLSGQPLAAVSFLILTLAAVCSKESVNTSLTLPPLLLLHLNNNPVSFFAFGQYTDW